MLNKCSNRQPGPYSERMPSPLLNTFQPTEAISIQRLSGPHTQAFKYSAHTVQSHSFPLSGLGADPNRAVRGFYPNLAGTSGSSVESDLHRLDATNARQSDRLDMQGLLEFVSCEWRGGAWDVASAYQLAALDHQSRMQSEPCRGPRRPDIYLCSSRAHLRKSDF